jgi:hypothetical protein
VRTEHRTERAAEHEAFERQAGDASAFGERTAGSGEQIRNRDANRLREK